MNPKQENLLAKGRYKFTKAKLETPFHFWLSEYIDVIRKEGGNFLKYVEILNRICKTEVIYVDNIVPTVGRENIANNMTDATPTSSLLVNKFAVGTGTNTPANADTTLQTETYRNDIASRTNASNVAYVTGFLNATEYPVTSVTIREAGIFAGGTGTANSGVLMSRVAINITKTNTETLTIDWTFTLS